MKDESTPITVKYLPNESSKKGRAYEFNTLAQAMKLQELFGGKIKGQRVLI